MRTLAARGAAPLDRRHLRQRDLVTAAAALHCIVIDASGSMATGGRLALAKGIAAALADAAGRRRDDVAVLSFSGGRTVVHVPPGRARPGSGVRFAQLGGGGGTSLARGIADADALLTRAARRHPHQTRWLWLLTDGRSTQEPGRPHAADHVHIVDLDGGRVTLGRNAALAARWGAECHPSADFFEDRHPRRGPG